MRREGEYDEGSEGEEGIVGLLEDYKLVDV
jgi:hypothetical protein